MKYLLDQQHMSRRSFATAASLCLTGALSGLTGPLTLEAQAETPAQKRAVSRSPENDHLWVRPAENSQEENLPDGSTGRMSEFHGCEGSFIASYLRKPKGAGPFPMVVMLHGGGVSPKGAYGLGRSNPMTTAFVAAGWAILSIDFPQTAVPLSSPGGAIPFPALCPIEWHDAIAATEAARNLSFVHARRIAIIGGSHGGYVMSKVLSRSNIQAAILCSPAMFDYIELSKAIANGDPAINHIHDKVAEAEQHYGAKLDVVAKNPECYGYESSMAEAKDTRCPVLIINGTNDTSSPIAVMKAYAAKLHSLGKTVETFFPDNAPHGFYYGHPKHLHPQTDDAITHAVAFIRKCFA